MSGISRKRVRVLPPVNVGSPERLFGRLDFEAYAPELLPCHGYTLVTRIGQCFSARGIVRRTMYVNVFVFLRSLAVAFGSLLRRGTTVIQNEKKIAIVHTPWSAGYYHWITESIPRLLACLDSGEKFQVMLPGPEHYSNYTESLRLVGITDIAYFPGGRNVLLKEALLTTVPKRFGTIDPTCVRRIRDLYTNSLPAKNESTPDGRRIYVTRKLARGRKVLNEDDVISILEKYGFETLAFENLSFGEQVALMSNTEALISIHGAALTNMTFMPSNGLVIELIPRKNGFYDFNLVRLSLRHDSCYVRLASALGHSYFALECTPVNLKNKSTHMADLVVNTELLEQTLASIYSHNQ